MADVKGGKVAGKSKSASKAGAPEPKQVGRNSKPTIEKSSTPAPAGRGGDIPGSQSR